MIDNDSIVKGMEVIDTVETHVGIVEHHEGTGFRLSHRDAPDHHHHYIPHHWVSKVDLRVHLKRTAADVFDSWPGGYPSGLKRPQPLFVEPVKPRNWKAWGALGAGGVGLLLLILF